MKLANTSYKVLKGYPALSFSIIASIVFISLFEGATFGMLIPLIQSMSSPDTMSFHNIPFIGAAISTSKPDITKTITITFVMLFAIISVKNLLVYVNDILIARLRFGIMRDLRVKLMDNLVYYDTKYFDSAKMGHLLSTLSNETMRISDFVMAMLQLVALAGRVFAYLVVLLLISWKATILIFASMVIMLLPIEIVKKMVKKIGFLISQALADYNQRTAEIINGIRLIKCFGTEEKEKRKFKNTTDRIFYLFYRSRFYTASVIPFSEILIFMLVTAYVLFLVNIAKIDVKNAFPFIATYLVVLARMLTQLNGINNQRSSAMNDLAAFESYEKLLDASGKMTIFSGTKKDWLFRNEIKFKNVHFSYDGNNEVLSDVNIMIPKGKMTALVGLSGAGKTTLINLIPRFYDVSCGEITVDGINIKDLDLSSWRQCMGFVSQDIFIFNANVIDNIAYGLANVSKEDVVKAAKIANADSFIMSLPSGYDTILGERGYNLSGGQKQRISIARAILHNPEILILDEATSSLDSETERIIKDAIDRLTKDRTVISIAHRLSTISHSDQIIVLDRGRVAERGSHADLVVKDGKYRRLYDAQFNI